MRCEGTCIRCAVDAHDACDTREPCDCRAEAHKAFTPRERGAQLAALTIRLASDIALHNTEVLRFAGAELSRASATGGRTSAEHTILVVLRAFILNEVHVRRLAGEEGEEDRT